MESSKNRLVALLLCWFVGMLGVHRIYAGRVGSGVAQLLLTITFFGLFITAIWCLIDLIQIAVGEFRDADDKKITKWV